MKTIQVARNEKEKEKLKRTFDKIKKHQQKIDELVCVCEEILFGEKKEKIQAKHKIKQTIHQRKELNKRLEILERKEKVKEISPEVRMLIENWNSFAKSASDGTKSKEIDIKTLKSILAGTFYNRKELFKKEYKGRKFSVSEIIGTFHKFDLMKNNTRYAPLNKKWMSSIRINTFFWNEYSTGKKSLFLHLLTSEVSILKKNTETLSEKEQKLIKIIGKKYNKIKNTSYPPEEFIEAAIQMNAFLLQYKNKFTHKQSPTQLCTILFSLLQKRYPDRWTIGHISTSVAFSRLIDELKSRKIIK